MNRKRLAATVCIALAIAGAGTQLRGAPHRQVVHYVLSSEQAAQARELDARWAQAGDGDDWTRTASFRYEKGLAPRVITHESQLADGSYKVQIDLVGDSGHTRLERQVKLGGGATTVYLADSVGP